jgi:hypothetical protein
MGFLQESQETAGIFSGIIQAGLPPTFDGKKNRLLRGALISSITPTSGDNSTEPSEDIGGGE